MDSAQSTSEQAGIGPEITQHVVSAGVNLAGGILSLCPQAQLYGVALSSASGVLGTAASRVHLFRTEAKAQRVEQFADEVREGLDPEILAERGATVQDLLTEAATFAADAETDEKRRMMARIIVAAAVRTDAEAAKLEALVALRHLQQMPPEAAALFALLSRQRERESEAGNRPDVLPLRARDGYCGLPPVVVKGALQHLVSAELIHHSQTEIKNVADFVRLRLMGRLHTVSFTGQGEWLLAWVRGNPPPPEESPHEDEP